MASWARGAHGDGGSPDHGAGQAAASGNRSSGGSPARQARRTPTSLTRAKWRRRWRKIRSSLVTERSFPLSGLKHPKGWTASLSSSKVSGRLGGCASYSRSSISVARDADARDYRGATWPAERHGAVGATCRMRGARPFRLRETKARRDYRSASGIHFFPVGPVYSDSGRMSRLWACCSMTCAHQPAIRPTAKIDVPRSAGIPRKVYVVAA